MNIRTDIGGFVFNLSASAYQILEAYFLKIDTAFKEEEAREIAGDIEFRIAELLKEAGKDADIIVDQEDINRILNQLGFPFEEESEIEEETFSYQESGRKPLFRHPENRYLGGVSGGIGLWLNINPNIIRVVFIILSLFKGIGLLIYGVLWAITPEAKSRTQLLQMQGKAPNLDNLKLAIEDEFKALQNSFSRFSDSEGFKQFPKIINKILNIAWHIILAIFKILLFTVGFVMLIAASVLLFIFISTLFFPESVYSPLSWINSNLNHGIYEWIFPAGQALMLKFGLALFIGIPIFFILLAAIRILFHLPYQHKKIFRISGLFLWLAGLFMLITVGLNEHRFLKEEIQSTKSYSLKKWKSDTLYISFDNQEFEALQIGNEKFELNDVTWNIKQDKPELMGLARIYMRVSEDSTFRVKEIKSANAANEKEAQKEAQNIDFQWQQKDSLLIIPKYFSLKNQASKWKLQELRFYIYVPQGKAVKFLMNIRHQRIYGIDRYLAHNIPKIWVVENGHFVNKYEEKQDNLEKKNIQTKNQTKEEIQNDSLKPKIKMEDELKEMKQELDNL